MINKKHIAIALAIVTACSVMTGCTKGGTKEKYTTEYEGEYMKVNNDGSIMIEYSEDFDSKKYSVDELNAMVEEEVKDFNAEYSTDNGMSVESVKVSNNTAKVRLDFNDVEDFVLYNDNYVNSEQKMKFYVGTYDKAKKEGFFFEEEFKQVDKKGKLDIDDILEVEGKENLLVICTDHCTTIKTETPVKYISSNVKKNKETVFTEEGKDNYIICVMEDKQ